MSQSTEELKTAVEGASEVLTETATVAEQLTSQATELAEEAAGHGWHGISTRMQEVAEALEATAGQIATGRRACENAVEDLGLINDKIPAGEVVGHLSVSTNQLGEAETALQGAVEKAEEAQTAAAEIGQEGMMQATLDLYGRLTEIHEQIGQLRSTSDEEQTAAEVYAQKQLTLGGARGSPTPPPSTGTAPQPADWANPQARRDWFNQQVNDPTNSRAFTRTQPWGDYQRQVAGPREVRIGKKHVGPQQEDGRIWADSLHLDPDTVVAAEAKYVSTPGRSLYEGQVPPALREVLLADFDLEMDRYAKAIRDPDNPVGRLRIITSTQAAADFLEARASRVLGPHVDLQVRYVPLKGQP